MATSPQCLVSLLMVSTLLASAGCGVGESQAWYPDPEVQLAQSTSAAHLCAAALQAIEQGQVEKAERLLLQRLELELEAADRAVAQGAALPRSPELRLGAERVAAYAERAALPAETQARARRVAAAFQD